MLRLNVLVVLSFIFCLDVVNSSPANNELLEIYSKQLSYEQYRLVHKPKKNLLYEKVCNLPKEFLAALCKVVIRRLRSENKEIYNFYVNYLPYTVQKPCTNVKVWVNQENILAHQTAVSCFARPAIIALDSTEEITSLYRKVVLYPWNTDHVMVFEYNENKDYYTLLKYHLTQWNRLHRTVTSLFYIPMPQSWSRGPDLYSILYPIHSTLNDYSTNKNNIVNTKDVLTLFKICYVAFRAETYNKKLYFNGKGKKIQPQKLRATIQGPIGVRNLSISIMARNCKYSVADDETFLSKYYVAPGPSDHSVILLEEVRNNNDGHPRYEIIEFIEHLTKDYIHFLFNFSY